MGWDRAMQMAEKDLEQIDETYLEIYFFASCRK